MESSPFCVAKDINKFYVAQKFTLRECAPRKDNYHNWTPKFVNALNSTTQIKVSDAPVSKVKVLQHILYTITGSIAQQYTHIDILCYSFSQIIIFSVELSPLHLAHHGMLFKHNYWSHTWPVNNLFCVHFFISCYLSVRYTYNNNYCILCTHSRCISEKNGQVFSGSSVKFYISSSA